MSRNAGNSCENGKFDAKVKATGENYGFGETGEISPKSMTKVKDFMQMSWLKAPINGADMAKTADMVKAADLTELAKFHQSL